jgi:regulatory protein
MSSWGKYKPDQHPKMSWTLAEAKGKLETYCAYQERCPWEVRKKLFEKGIQGEAAEKLIEELCLEGFLEEERFAKSFARGKFRIKKWGKTRIIQALQLRKINPKTIQAGLSEIDPEEYYDTLLTLTEKTWEKSNEKDPFKKRFKVIHYLMGRGYEQDLVQEAVASLQSQ